LPAPEEAHSDVEGGEMATTILSSQTIGEMVAKLGSLALSPSELEELAPHLETLYQDLQILASVDLGEVEPETMFDVHGE
jgi:Asp-tRNA(Asn)/Glu-tRNA(Gln) amidotransferase C subunit